MKRTLAGTSGVLMAAGVLAAQQPTFRAGVDHVSVDVVVTDTDDRPISDLTQADFGIIDGGRAQTISDFEFVSVPVVHRTLDVAETSVPPADVVTNDPPSRKSRIFA